MIEAIVRSTLHTIRLATKQIDEAMDAGTLRLSLEELEEELHRTDFTLWRLVNRALPPLEGME